MCICALERKAKEGYNRVKFWDLGEQKLWRMCCTG